MHAAGQSGTTRGSITVKVTIQADSHELDQSDTIWNVFMGLNRIDFSFMSLVGLVQVRQAKLALRISHMLLLFTVASS